MLRPDGVLWLPLVVCLLVGTLAPRASAQFRVDSFTTSNGLPQNTVAALAQTRDGYLWIATYDGLARYDGVRFTVFDKGNTPALRNTQFLSLWEDAAGTLWAGSVEGGLVRYRDGVFTSLTTADGLPDNFVGRFQETPRGLLIFHSSAGVISLRTLDGRLAPADAAALSEFVGPSGTRWRHEPDRLTQIRDGRSTTYLVTISADDFARFRFEDRQGGLWIGSRASGVYHASGGDVRHYAVADGVPVDQIVKVGGQDRAGRVWIHGTGHLLFFDGTRFVPVDLGDPAPFIRAVVADREGTVWVGTNDRGLLRLGPDYLRTYSQADGLPGRGVYPVMEAPDGAILAGAGGTVARLLDGAFTQTVLPSVPRALFLDRDGTIWVGLSPGLMTLKDGTLTDRSALVNHVSIDVVLRDRSGVLWAGGTTGLYRIDANGTRLFGVADGLPVANVTALLEDRVGRLWVATFRGIARRDGDRFVAFGPKEGLPGDRIRTLYEDASGALWVGTFDSGLSRYQDGRFTTYTTQTGLFANGVFAILEDARGWLWMSSNRGIFRVARQQLEEVAAGRRTLVSSVAYGIQDGMRSVECNGGRQPAGIKARDGRLWFPTTDGIVSIDPTRAYSDLAPPLAVESVLVDGAPVAFGAGVTVAPGQADVEINYTAPTFFKAAHVQFRYALSSGDEGWIDAGTRRTVHYSHLAPGRYRFRVDAASSEGLWNGAGAAVDLNVLPYFYQTVWFKAVVVFAMIGAGAAAFAWRIRRMKAAERVLILRVTEATAELAAANRRLELLATTDALTGLANRRRFSEFLDHEFQRAAREHAPFALLMLDVDFFKRFNDTRGHQAGDECLRRVAAVIGGRIKRSSDLAARYGGEEFAVILSGADEDGATSVARFIRAEIEKQQIAHGASSVSDYVTVSIGVAIAAPAAGGSPERLMAEADAALYRAKALGRNTVAASSTATPAI